MPKNTKTSWVKDIKKTITNLKLDGCHRFHLEWRIWNDYGRSEKAVGYIGYFWYLDKKNKVITPPPCIMAPKVKDKIQKDFKSLIKHHDYL